MERGCHLESPAGGIHLPWWALALALLAILYRAEDRRIFFWYAVAVIALLAHIALALLKRSTPVDAELLAGTEDHVVQAAIDPDSVPAEGAAPGRDAIARLRG